MDVIEKLRQHWLVATTSDRLRDKPLGITILETPIVLFRAAGGISAQLDRCPHRNAPLSAGKIIDGMIQCPYHGWRFDIGGRCTRRPGCAKLDHVELSCHNRAFQVCQQDGLVWINFSETPQIELPTRSDWFVNPEFDCFHWSNEIESDYLDAIENLLDGTHTPFVHAGLIRTESKPQILRVVVRVNNDRIEAEYLEEGKQSGWISRIFERERTSSFGRFISPCIAELEYRSRRHTEFVLNAHFSPTTNGRVQVISTFFVRRTRVPSFLKRWLLAPFFRRVLKQDAEILRLQQSNVRRFGGADFVLWEGDLLRGLIDSWFRTGRFPDGFDERKIELHI